MKPLAVLHDPLFQKHQTPGGHPERSERLRVLESLFQENGRWRELPRLTFSPATLEDLHGVHTPAHLERIAKTQGVVHSVLDPDTHTSSQSFAIALHAVGACYRAASAVMNGEVQRAFALVRPPGHHAESNRAMGFCLFNNVAAAAFYLRKNFALERILILDWDVHHGNGTQEIFYGDPQVLYLSLHQFPFYPGTGDFLEVGEKEGEGYTVNIPLPAGMGDADYREAFEQIVEPIVLQYAPQMILISAGYDAYFEDPLGGQAVTVAGFSWMAQKMMALAEQCCEGKIVLALEGGYHLEGLKACLSANFEVLTDAGSAIKLAPEKSAKIKRVIDEVKRVQKRYWKV